MNDLIVVPTSVSSIELSATTRFTETIGWVSNHEWYLANFTPLSIEGFEEELATDLSAHVIFLYRLCFTQFITTIPGNCLKAICIRCE